MIAKVKVNHCNIVNNNYQQESRVLFAFISNKSFGQLLDTSPKKKLFIKSFSSGFLCFEVWFTDQNSKPLELEDDININFVINWSLKYKKWHDI